MELKPGYKLTEVGVIPNDWDVQSLEENADPKRPICYGIVQVGPFVRNGIPVLAIKNLNVDYFASIHRTSHDIEAPYARSRVRPGDVLISVKGTTGRVGIVPANFDGNISRDIARLRLTDDDVPAFWFHLLQSDTGQREMGLATVGTTRMELSIGILKHVRMPRPPKQEQRAIAGALSDVDALIGALDQLLAKKRDLKQAAMQQLLTGQTRLPGWDGAWEVNTVAELEKQKLVKLSRGQVISKKDIDNTPGDFPIYSSSIHNDGLFGRYGDFMFDEELITWSVDGGGNFFHRRKHKFSVTNVCGFMWVDTSRIDYRFFAAELQLLHSRKSFDYQSKAHPSVVRKEYEVQLPPLPEQTAIASVLSEMDGELAMLEQRREKTRALKQAMMQELLTGRTRLV